MAFKDKDLLKPSIYALIVGMIVSVIGIIPIIGAFFLFGGSHFGNIILFILGAILIFVQFVVSYVFSGMTVYLIYGYLAEGDGRMDKAWDIVQRDLFDIVTLAAVSTVVSLLRNVANRNRGGIGASLARGATNLLQVLWTEASYLMSARHGDRRFESQRRHAARFEDHSENLLLIGISTVGVRLVTGLIRLSAWCRLVLRLPLPLVAVPHILLVDLTLFRSSPLPSVHWSSLHLWWLRVSSAPTHPLPTIPAFIFGRVMWKKRRPPAKPSRWLHPHL